MPSARVEKAPKVAAAWVPVVVGESAVESVEMCGPCQPQKADSKGHFECKPLKNLLESVGIRPSDKEVRVCTAK